MVYAHDSKSCDLTIMWVQVPPWVLSILTFGKYSDYCVNMQNIIPIAWTPNLAYAVGLITTDGCLSKDGRHIDFTSKDSGLIYTFKDILGLKNKIGLKSSSTSNKMYYRIQFGNVNFYKFLLRIGLTPAKSKTLGALKIPDKYFTDFLRGHLDGDGSIITYVDNNNHYLGRTYTNQRVYIYFISVSRNHIDWLHSQIIRLAHIKGSIQCKPHKNKDYLPMWVIKIAKKESIKLLKWIYYQPNLPALKRKSILAKQILEIVNKEERKKYTKILEI